MCAWARLAISLHPLTLLAGSSTRLNAGRHGSRPSWPCLISRPWAFRTHRAGKEGAHHRSTGALLNLLHLWARMTLRLAQAPLKAGSASIDERLQQLAGARYASPLQWVREQSLSRLGADHRSVHCCRYCSSPSRCSTRYTSPARIARIRSSLACRRTGSAARTRVSCRLASDRAPSIYGDGCGALTIKVLC